MFENAENAPRRLTEIGENMKVQAFSSRTYDTGFVKPPLLISRVSASQTGGPVI
jgi:hypothetical protein